MLVRVMRAWERASSRHTRRRYFIPSHPHHVSVKICIHNSSTSSNPRIFTRNVLTRETFSLRSTLQRLVASGAPNPRVVRAQMFIFPAPHPIFIALNLLHGPVCGAGCQGYLPTQVHVVYVQVSSIDETQPKQGFVNSTSRGWFHWLARGKPHSRAHPTPMSL